MKIQLKNLEKDNLVSILNSLLYKYKIVNVTQTETIELSEIFDLLKQNCNLILLSSQVEKVNERFNYNARNQALLFTLLDIIKIDYEIVDNMYPYIDKQLLTISILIEHRNKQAIFIYTISNIYVDQIKEDTICPKEHHLVI